MSEHMVATAGTEVGVSPPGALRGVKEVGADVNSEQKSRI